MSDTYAHPTPTTKVSQEKLILSESGQQNVIFDVNFFTHEQICSGTKSTPICQCMQLFAQSAYWHWRNSHSIELELEKASFFFFIILKHNTLPILGDPRVLEVYVSTRRFFSRVYKCVIGSEGRAMQTNPGRYLEYSSSTASLSLSVIVFSLFLCNFLKRSFRQGQQF